MTSEGGGYWVRRQREPLTDQLRLRSKYHTSRQSSSWGNASTAAGGAKSPVALDTRCARWQENGGKCWDTGGVFDP